MSNASLCGLNHIFNKGKNIRLKWKLQRAERKIQSLTAVIDTIRNVIYDHDKQLYEDLLSSEYSSNTYVDMSGGYEGTEIYSTGSSTIQQTIV